MSMISIVVVVMCCIVDTTIMSWFEYSAILYSRAVKYNRRLL